MKRHQSAHEQCEMVSSSAVFNTETSWLVQCGFTSEEIIGLLWLRQWYQSGGSDRTPLVRHWEFLKLLVMRDILKS